MFQLAGKKDIRLLLELLLGKINLMEKIMICKNCNKENPENSNVCGYCGALLNNKQNKEYLNDDIKSKINEEFKEKKIDVEKIIDDKALGIIEEKTNFEEPALPVKTSSMMSYSKLAKKRKPLSTAAFFGMQLLLLIPIVNLFLLFIWAFRKKTNANRQAYARSILIWLLILFIIASTAAVLLIYVFNFDITNLNKFIKF